jgi:hypothetical protein
LFRLPSVLRETTAGRPFGYVGDGLERRSLYKKE